MKLKKQSLKQHKKKPELTRVTLLTHDSRHEIGISPSKKKQKKSRSSKPNNLMLNDKIETKINLKK